MWKQGAKWWNAQRMQIWLPTVRPDWTCMSGIVVLRSKASLKGFEPHLVFFFCLSTLSKLLEAKDKITCKLFEAEDNVASFLAKDNTPSLLFRLFNHAHCLQYLNDEGCWWALLIFAGLKTTFCRCFASPRSATHKSSKQKSILKIKKCFFLKKRTNHDFQEAQTIPRNRPSNCVLFILMEDVENKMTPPIQKNKNSPSGFGKILKP